MIFDRNSAEWAYVAEAAIGFTPSEIRDWVIAQYKIWVSEPERLVVVHPTLHTLFAYLESVGVRQ